MQIQTVGLAENRPVVALRLANHLVTSLHQPLRLVHYCYGTILAAAIVATVTTHYYSTISY